MSLYVICYQLESSHTASTVGLTKEIVYQNLIIGAVSKQQALLYTLVLLTANFSQERAAHYLSLYEDNLNFLQSIKLLGSRPYQLPVLLVSNATISSQTFYSDEFIFAFINNVVSLYSNISDKTTSAGLVAGYLSADPNKLAYLFANSNITKEVMRDKLTLRISEIVSVISKYETIQCAVLAIGLVSLVCFALCVGMLIYRISQ